MTTQHMSAHSFITMSLLLGTVFWVFFNSLILKNVKWRLSRVWFLRSSITSASEVFILCQCRDYENLLGYRLLCTCVLGQDVYFIYTSASYPHNGDNNSIYLVGSLWGLNELIHVKHLEGCLVHDNCSSYVTYYHCCCYR